MTEKQKLQIRYYRQEGYGYTAIAHKLGISINTVKTHCRRSGLTGIASKKQYTFCCHCDKMLDEATKKTGQRFCSEQCRRAWWKEHPELVIRKAYYSMTCAHCGEVFRSYGNKNRKYCCHACYIAARFGVDRNEKGGAVNGKNS